MRRGPTGPSRFSYGGPYADGPDPCTLFTKDGRMFGPPIDIPTRIGDGRVCMPNTGRGNRRLVFRVGRTVVYLHNWLYADATDLNALTAELTPVARSIAARL